MEHNSGTHHMSKYTATTGPAPLRDPIKCGYVFFPRYTEVVQKKYSSTTHKNNSYVEALDHIRHRKAFGTIFAHQSRGQMVETRPQRIHVASDEHRVTRVTRFSGNVSNRSNGVAQCLQYWWH